MNNPADAEREVNIPQRRRERDVLYSDTSLYLCVANSSGMCIMWKFRLQASPGFIAVRGG